MSEKQVVNIQRYDSPCGEIILGSIGDALCLCDWNGKPCALRDKRRIGRLFNAGFKEDASDVIKLTIKELNEYFAGARRSFDIPLRLAGSEFQQGVWRVLRDIPYGETRTYMYVADKVNNPRGVRAVARAIGTNPMSVIIPCHRVIGTDGSLTGFAGGLDVKRFLLALEGRPANRTQVGNHQEIT